MENRRLNIMLIGCGPHAKRIYVPLMEIFKDVHGVNLKLVVDLRTQEVPIREHFASVDLDPDFYFVEGQLATLGSHLNSELSTQLTQKANDAEIDGVIVASEPLSHLMYLNWALEQDYSVLTDKPITCYENISTNPELPGQFSKDFSKLVQLYESKRALKPTLNFTVMSQRRYHNSFNIMRGFIADCFEQTNCPVTSFNTHHSDGQWRSPIEMINQLYHSYYQGYGKCSHSGYHYFDILPYLISAATSDDKDYDEIETFTRLVRPNDFLSQVSLEDHQILGEDFSKLNNFDPDQLKETLRTYGEVDSFSQITLMANKNRRTNISLNLTHTGVSQRDWADVGKRCLYKGIGRVSHETHLIEQGPFQAIQFHSYKSKENEAEPKEYGGENHLEVVVYRNNRLLGGRHVQRFNMSDFEAAEQDQLGLRSVAKTKCFLEWIQAQRKPRFRTNSDLLTHLPSTLFVQTIYQSAANDYHGLSPVVKAPFDLHSLRFNMRSENFPIKASETV